MLQNIHINIKCIQMSKFLLSAFQSEISKAKFWNLKLGIEFNLDNAMHV